MLANAGEEDAIVLNRAIQLRNKLKAVGPSSSVKAIVYRLVGYRMCENISDIKKPLVTAHYAVDYIKKVKGTFAVSSKDEFRHELNECRQDYTG